VTSPEEAARRLATLPAVLVEASPRAVRASGARLETQARRNLRTASGDLRLSRVRSGKGARVDVRLEVQGSGTGARALVLPVGPVSLVEGDTRAHVQPFRYVADRTGGQRSYSMARRRKARRSPVLYIPGVGVRSYVKHPGTKGQHPVKNAMGQAAPVAGRVGAEVYARAIARHLS